MPEPDDSSTNRGESCAIGGQSQSAVLKLLHSQLADMFPGASGGVLKLNDPTTARMLDQVEEKILAVKPANDRQKWLDTQALQLVASMSGAGWQFSDKNLGTIPLPLLVVVIAWLAILFASFGIFASKNATVIVSLLL
jgi:hypothetical protein